MFKKIVTQESNGDKLVTTTIFSVFGMVIFTGVVTVEKSK